MNQLALNLDMPMATYALHPSSYVFVLVLISRLGDASSQHMTPIPRTLFKDFLLVALRKLQPRTFLRVEVVASHSDPLGSPMNHVSAVTHPQPSAVFLGWTFCGYHTRSAGGI